MTTADPFANAQALINNQREETSRGGGGYLLAEHTNERLFLFDE